MTGENGGELKQCTADDGLIKPELIPCNGLDAEKITSSATDLRAEGKGVRSNAASVATTWTGLAASYKAPESGTLLALMDPVASDADLFATKMESVADILDDFADAIPPIKTALEGLKTEATAFVAEVKNGVWVEPSEAGHPQFHEWVSRQANSSGLTAPASYSSPSVGGDAPEPEPLRGTTIDWKDHQPSIDRNRDLMHRVADEYAKLDKAQVEAANGILALVENSCVAPLTAVEAWQLKQDGVALPWGTAIEKNRDCGESFVHGMGEAVVSFGEGIGSLFGYNPLKGEWGDGEWAGQAWQGLGLTLAGLATAGPLSLAIRFAPPGTVPEPVRTFVADSQDALTNAVKGIVAYDTWSENPAEAAGTTLVNIGTFFIPGAGQVGGVLKATAAGARVASITGFVGKVVDVAVPGGSFVVKGLAEGTLAATLRFGRGLDDLVDVSALTKVPDFTMPTNPGSALAHGAGDAPGGSPFDAPNLHVGGDVPVASGHVGGPDVDLGPSRPSAGLLDNVRDGDGGASPTTLDAPATTVDRGGDSASNGDGGQGTGGTGAGEGATRTDANGGGVVVHIDPDGHIATTTVDDAGDVTGGPDLTEADRAGSAVSDSAVESTSTGEAPGAVPSVSVGDSLSPEIRTTLGQEGRYNLAFFDRVQHDQYWDVPAPVAGPRGGNFWVTDLADGAYVSSPEQAARATGMSPATVRSWLGYPLDSNFDPIVPAYDPLNPNAGKLSDYERQLVGVVFPDTDVNPRVRPTDNHAGGYPHFLESADPAAGRTAVRTSMSPGGGYLVNTGVREWVIRGGGQMPPGSFLFRVDPDGSWVIERVF